LGDPGVNVRIILRLIFRRWGVGAVSFSRRTLLHGIIHRQSELYHDSGGCGVLEFYDLVFKHFDTSTYCCKHARMIIPVTPQRNCNHSRVAPTMIHVILIYPRFKHGNFFFFPSLGKKKLPAILINVNITSTIQVYLAPARIKISFMHASNDSSFKGDLPPTFTCPLQPNIYSQLRPIDGGGWSDNFFPEHRRYGNALSFQLHSRTTERD
jgi:hypothetical protein